MRVLLLFDLETPASTQVYDEELRTEEWESEAGVLKALRASGHEVKLYGICDDVTALIGELREFRPDLVFNLVEALHGDRSHEPTIAGLLEALGIRFTGASSKTLQTCKDKAMAKAIVGHALENAGIEGARVPLFALSPRLRPLETLGKLPFPAIVKPVGLEASAGIALSSLVADEKSCQERVRFIHERLGQDAIVEEYIDGREIYVSILGDWDGEIEIFPPRELFFGASDDAAPRFATFKAKWDDEYRRRRRIRNGFARSLGSAEPRLRAAAECIYRALQIRGYARLDLRIDERGEVVFIEANPNPSIAEKDDFALSAQKAGLSYADLIKRLVKLSERSGLRAQALSLAARPQA